MRRRARPALVAGAVLLVAAAAAAVWRFAFHDTATPADVSAAVERFRRQTVPAEHAGLPAAGVYVYETQGFEAIDALGGVRHVYPRRSTITVTPTVCGATLRWDVLAARSTAWRLCKTQRGLVLRSANEVHQFFGRTERTDYICSAHLFRPTRDVPGTRSGITCREGDTLERGSGRVVARETLRVGGRAVPTVHVRERVTLSGGTHGASVQDTWLRRADALPVRIVMTSTTTNPSAIGDVTYRERVTLRLVSLEPRR